MCPSLITVCLSHDLRWCAWTVLSNGNLADGHCSGMAVLPAHGSEHHTAAPGWCSTTREPDWRKHPSGSDSRMSVHLMFRSHMRNPPESDIRIQECGFTRVKRHRHNGTHSRHSRHCLYTNIRPPSGTTHATNNDSCRSSRITIMSIHLLFSCPRL